MTEAATFDITRENRRVGGLVGGVARGGLVVGLLGLVLSVVLAFVAGREQFFRSYLVAFAYCLSLALGGLFFVILQHLTKAGWSAVVRRLAEVVTSVFPLLAMLAIPIVVGMGVLYPWTDPAQLGEEAKLVAGKSAYLNAPFFIVRLVFYFVAWTWLARFFMKTSVAQDESGEVRLTRRMQAVSAPGMILYGLTTTFAAFDLLMSLNPVWFSTIFGVYYFAGAVVGFMALLILICVGLQATGRLQSVITPEHYHDMGKLLFAFVVFWAYIAFSQYMLIWYANLPETTFWFYERQIGGWKNLSLLLLFGHFVLPFLALMSRVPKRRKQWLTAGAAWLLFVHWIDIYYLVMPMGEPHVPLHLLDGTCLLGVGGLFVAGIAWSLGRQSLLAERDPRLPESLLFENI